jgi:hypothetical protein
MPDEQTQEKTPEFHREVAEAAAKAAELEEQKGVYETNNDNRGPRVDEYQMVNNTLGQAWCAKFAYWCFMQAALQMKVANPFPRIFGARELGKWGIHRQAPATKTASTTSRGNCFPIAPSFDCSGAGFRRSCPLVASLGK